MNDLISRQAAIDAIDEYDFEFPNYMERFVTELRDAMKADLKNDIEALPSAQPERESGEWIIADTQNEEDEQNGNYRYTCSCCGYSDIHSKAVRVPYCWHCGAKMNEVDE